MGSGLGRGLLGLRGRDLLQEVVLLQISAELVVVNTLLEADERVVKLHVELGALLEQHCQVVSNQDGLVDLLEELALRRVVAHRTKELLQYWCALLDGHCNLLLLLL